MRTRTLAFLTLILSATAPALAGNRAQGTLGAVYAMTNAETGNQVLAYDRFAGGTLGAPEVYDTGGLGFVNGVPIDPLGSQGSLVLSRDHRWLLAVNAGSNQLSVFRVLPQGLKLTDVVDSGGVLPVSVTIYRDLVYVLNAGGNLDDVDQITGFVLGPHGRLSALAGSTRALSQDSTNPAQVGFTPDGSALVVTEKAVNRLDVFPVRHRGLPSAAPVVTDSAGPVPFGFVFDHRGHLVVSEAAGSVSSYEINGDGSLTAISSAVPNGQTATCWIAGNGGRVVFTANTGSGTLSSYRVARRGDLDLIEPVAVDVPGALPIDTAMTRNGRFLYTVNALTGTVGMFAAGPFGALEHLGDAPGIPVNDGAQGIAAR
jgi:6-phosphogluconolactonase (cycloisomerase 2 family)